MVRRSKLAIVLGTVLVLQAPVVQAGVSWGTCRQVYHDTIGHVVEEALKSARRVFTVDGVDGVSPRSVKQQTRRTPAKTSSR